GELQGRNSGRAERRAIAAIAAGNAGQWQRRGPAAAARPAGSAAVAQRRAVHSAADRPGKSGARPPPIRGPTGIDGAGAPPPGRARRTVAVDRRRGRGPRRLRNRPPGIPLVRIQRSFNRFLRLLTSDPCPLTSYYFPSENLMAEPLDHLLAPLRL